MAKESAVTFARTQLQGAREEASDEPMHVLGDAISGTIRVSLWIWDTDSLSWVKMQQPTLADGVVEDLLAGTHWKDQRFDYTSGNLDYRGLNISHKADTAAETWLISKYTWSGENITRIEGPLVGAWDDRAVLAWA